MFNGVSEPEFQRKDNQAADLMHKRKLTGESKDEWVMAQPANTPCEEGDIDVEGEWKYKTSTSSEEETIGLEKLQVFFDALERIEDTAMTKKVEIKGKEGQRIGVN